MTDFYIPAQPRPRVSNYSSKQNVIVFMHIMNTVTSLDHKLIETKRASASRKTKVNSTQLDPAEPNRAVPLRQRRAVFSSPPRCVTHE